MYGGGGGGCLWGKAVQQVVPHVSLCVEQPYFHVLCRSFSEGKAAVHEIDHSSSSSATGSGRVWNCHAMPTVGFRGTLWWLNAVYL